MSHYHVIVIGGGHAGAEAANAAARMGARTLLVTQNLETIGQMSCNPAIGGIAKGTVVREVDALGGVMARATDRSRLQFRMLNRSKGPAVWSPRAQCDRGLYRRAVRGLLERQPTLEFAQATIAGVRVEGGRIRGVVTTDGRRFGAESVVLTAGTFLRGRIHMGRSEGIAGGRAGEPAAVELSQVLKAEGLTVARFKTGTPPRVDGRSVDLGRLERQDGDPGGYRFSHLEHVGHPPQLPCYVTWTGWRLGEIIRRHLGESALYGGEISGRGPRYCPSIEDKIVKFPSAERHQLFLEPEGLETTELYVNGLSTSLPVGVQEEFLRTVPGLEAVRMTRPGYAIEYDYFPPTQLAPTLELRAIGGLFFAGQVNGTTGYEEAAGQGIVAGINAAARALERDPLVLRRDQAFIGVLVDDLVNRGVDEPYRLFTSRSEYRLLLRQDNALRRLLPVSRRYGLLTEEEFRVAERRLEVEDECLERARRLVMVPEVVNPVLEAAGSRGIREPTRAAELVRRPEVRLASLLALDPDGVEPDADALHWAEVEIKYSGYVVREAASAARLAELEEHRLPADAAYLEFRAVSFEAREKLDRVRPATLGQASRIPGVSPSDLQGILLELARRAGRFT